MAFDIVELKNWRLNFDPFEQPLDNTKLTIRNKNKLARKESSKIFAPLENHPFQEVIYLI